MNRTRWLDESTLAITGDRARVKGIDMSPEAQIARGVGLSKRQVMKDIKAADYSIFDSKLERDYSQYLSALKFAGEVLDFYYHTVVLILPGGQRYTPDFMIWTKDLKPEIHECKGSPKMKNARDGITRLKVAAGTFKCFTFKLVYRRQGQWDVQMV